jgi:hypothetical protein
MNSTNWFSRINAFSNPTLLRATPWMTDGSVAFLRNFCLLFAEKHHTLPSILEFGAGAGTLFFASHAAALVTYEDNPQWCQNIKSVLETFAFGHCRMILAERPYSNCLNNVSEKYDVISIDGRDRVLCLKQCLQLGLLAQDGVLVLDNTERINNYGGMYKEMLCLLEDFSLIHFEQLGKDSTGWNAPHRWITTIAFRKADTQYTTQGAPL